MMRIDMRLDEHDMAAFNDRLSRRFYELKKIHQGNDKDTLSRLEAEVAALLEEIIPLYRLPEGERIQLRFGLKRDSGIKTIIAHWRLWDISLVRK